MSVPVPVQVPMQVPQPPGTAQYYPVSAPASTPGLPQKMVNWVAVNASTATIIIVILVILTIGMLFYYRGVFGFGPFNESSGGSGKKKKKKSSSSGNADDDPSTVDLIEQVNS